MSRGHVDIKAHVNIVQSRKFLIDRIYAFIISGLYDTFEIFRLRTLRTLLREASYCDVEARLL